MKKKILTIALAAFALCAIPASARNNNNNCGNCPKAPCTEQTCSPAQNCGPDQACRAPQGRRPDFFQGIQLTPDQQTALRALEQQRASQRPDSAARASRRDDNRRPDSAAVAQRRQARQDARRSYLDGVKSILTPEQYVVYLENCYMMQPGPKGPQHKVAARDGNNNGRREGNIRRGHDNNRRDHGHHAAVNAPQRRNQATVPGRK